MKCSVFAKNVLCMVALALKIINRGLSLNANSILHEDVVSVLPKAKALEKTGFFCLCCVCHST